MESKLKALKVVELKDILQRAGVTIPAKANKPDLIAKIISSPAAIDLFNNNGATAGESSRGGTPKAAASAVKAPVVAEKPVSTKVTTSAAEDLLEPPEEFDWNGDGGSASKETISTAQNATKTKSATKPAATSAKTSELSTSKPAASSVTGTAGVSVAADDEEEKKKARAARFGIPVVESKKPAAKQLTALASNGKSSATKPSVVANEDPDKLQARAARFGLESKPITNTTVTATTGVAAKNERKRPAPQETVDQEELERRKKRAERFGIPVKT